MTSGNDTGQGIGSPTTKIDDELKETHVREGASSGSEQSGDAADTTPAESSTESASTEASTENTESDATEAVADGDPAVQESAGRTVTEQIAEKAEPKAPDASPEVPPQGGSASATDSTPTEAEHKPIPSGFWRSAYEAGAGAPSSRYTTEPPAASNGASGKSASSLGRAIDNVVAPTNSEADEVDDTTKPRVSSHDTPPPNPPSEAWQRVSSPNAGEVPTAEEEPATAVNETNGQKSTDGDDPAAAVKQGAVKAAQAALAAARNAA
ncbi:hypothetical protein EDD34_0001, partial [Myceligenerans xiligouense]